MVTGHVDWSALDELTDMFLHTHGPGRHTGQPTGASDHAGPAEASCQPGPGQPIGQPIGQPGASHSGAGRSQQAGTGTGWATGAGQAAAAGPPSGSCLDSTGSGCTCARPAPEPLTPATRDRLRRALLRLAADALSGPSGLAARLRAALDGKPLTTLSLPLDIGAATETIPAHLRRAVTTRHSRCAFPGCDQPATVCDIHHLTPRSHGGPTSLPNLVPLCSFHHLTAIHRWGWTLTLHPDGTTTATSPDSKRTLHSHSPPSHGPPSLGPPGHGPPSRAAQAPPPQSSPCRVSASFGQGVAAWPAEERAGGRAVRCHRAGDALQEVLRGA